MFADEAADHRLFGVDNAYVVRDAVVLAGLMGDGNAHRVQEKRELAVEPLVFQNIQHLRAGFCGNDLALVQLFEQQPHFARGNAVFNAPCSRLAVKEQAAKTGLFAAKLADCPIHVLHADTADEDIRRRVVADDHHQPGQIQQRHFNACVHRLERAAGGQAFVVGKPMDFIQIQQPVPRLPKNFDHHRNFDDARRHDGLVRRIRAHIACDQIAEIHARIAAEPFQRRDDLFPRAHQARPSSAAPMMPASAPSRAS